MASIENISVTIFLLSVACVFAISYADKPSDYQRDKSKRIASDGEFKIVSPLIQISTLVISITSVWIESSWLLEVFQSRFLRIIGVSVCLLALVVYLSARRTLGKSYSPCFDSFVPSDLVLL